MRCGGLDDLARLDVTMPPPREPHPASALEHRRLRETAEKGLADFPDTADIKTLGPAEQAFAESVHRQLLAVIEQDQWTQETLEQSRNELHATFATYQTELDARASAGAPSAALPCFEKCVQQEKACYDACDAAYAGAGPAGIIPALQCHFRCQLFYALCVAVNCFFGPRPGPQ